MNTILQFLAKVSVTALVLLVIAASLFYLSVLWKGSKPIVSVTYFRDRKRDDAASQLFVTLLRRDLDRLHRVYTPGEAEDAPRRVPFSPNLLGRGEPLDIPNPEDRDAPTVEVEAFGVRLSALTTMLGRWLLGQKVWSVTLIEDETGVDGSIQFSGNNSAEHWRVTGHAGDASFRTACGMYRSLLRRRQYLGAADTDEFCALSKALTSYMRYVSRLTTGAPEVDVDAALTEAAADTEKVLATRMAEPLTYQLAAYVSKDIGKWSKARSLLQEYIKLSGAMGRRDERADRLMLQLSEESPSAKTALKSADDLGLRKRVRPLTPGLRITIASANPWRSTICCFVADPEGKKYFLTASSESAPIGTAVYQPDNEGETDLVGTVARIIWADALPSQPKLLLVELQKNVSFDSNVPGFGEPTGVLSAIGSALDAGMQIGVGLGDKFKVIGQTSGLIEAQHTGVNAPWEGFLGSKAGPRPGEFFLSKALAPGDLGALVIAQDGKLAGIVGDGTSQNSYAAFLSPLFTALNLIPYGIPSDDSQHSIGVAVWPEYPRPVSVGQTNVPASLGLTNGGGGRLLLSAIRLIPSCGHDDVPCRDMADPGVFSLKGLTSQNKAVARDGFAAAGMTFTIELLDPVTGEVEFVPDGNRAVVLGPPGSPNETCVIDFLIDVLRVPKHDADPLFPGVHTNQVGRVRAASASGLFGTGVGSNQTTVEPAEAEQAAN